MPHMPRRYASSVGVPPELMQRPVDKHPAIPVRRAEAGPEEKKPARLRMGLGRLSLRDHEPDFMQVCKTLFGKEPDVDRYTRKLVLAPGGPAAAPLGAQRAAHNAQQPLFDGLAAHHDHRPHQGLADPPLFKPFERRRG